MNQEPNKPAHQVTGSWAILGGAFDPIHRGHLTLASDILKARQMTGVLFVPSFKPPLKLNTCRGSYEDRVVMVRLALEPYPSFRLSTIESEMNQPGYTLNTVRALKEKHPQGRFYFLIGADLLPDISNWYRPDEILKEVPVLVGSRPTGSGMVAERTYQSERIEYVETSLIDISSSMIRDRVRNGLSLEELSQLVGTPVARYIVRRKLYR